MNRLSAIFTQRQKKDQKVLIPFITAGDPDGSPQTTAEAMHAMVAAGADIIELGMPYSDPMADGPVIQLASERALANGITLTKVLEAVTLFREKDAETGVVLMGYINPIEKMGYAQFAEQAQKSGVDGVLVVDLPLDESQDLHPILNTADIAPILLLAPTSTDERVKRTMAQAQGYVYYVSFKGTTGAAGLLDYSDVAKRLSSIRRFGDTPIAVGFGITDGASARAVGEVADGVVIGSALVKYFADHDAKKAIEKAAEKLCEIRTAIDDQHD